MSCNDKPLSPTEFKCIDTEGEIITLDSRQIPGGTLIDYSGSDYHTREAFRVIASNEGVRPWVLYTNMRLSHEQFTEMMRGRTNHPKILHWGL